jgi:serine/threonine protein kinase
MAPEQLTHGRLTPATDIYALGIMMYEAVTGHRPFTGDSAMSIAAKRLQESPLSPRHYVPGTTYLIWTETWKKSSCAASSAILEIAFKRLRKSAQR